jgi:hypothetical protein
VYISNKTVDIGSYKTPDIRLKTHLRRVNLAYGFALFMATKPHFLDLPFDTEFDIAIDCMYPDHT